MLDPVLLRTFLVVAETRSFTGAARRLGLRQSTVSQHVRKLESVVARQLLLRDTHSVELTGDGEVMTGFARTILDAGDRALTYFSGPELRGRLRLGASEDFVLGPLPEILRRFRRSHPLVELELTVELSGVLHERLRSGELDLVLAKQQPGGPIGQSADRFLSGEATVGTVWREPAVWAGPRGTELDPAAPVPLIAYPPPSITRALAVEALRGQGREWRVACTSGSLNGLRAAALAGLGVVVFARSLIPDGLVELPGLPDLGDVEFVLARRGSTLHGPARALAEAIIGNVLHP